MFLKYKTVRLSCVDVLCELFCMAVYSKQYPNYYATILFHAILSIHSLSPQLGLYNLQFIQSEIKLNITKLKLCVRLSASDDVEFYCVSHRVHLQIYIQYRLFLELATTITLIIPQQLWLSH